MGYEGLPVPGLRSTCIVEVPDKLPRAPLAVKIPVVLGNVEKLYAPVIVIGTGVRADAEGAEPIVKKAITHSAIATEIILLCRIVNIMF